MLIIADPLITGCRELFGTLGELRLIPGRSITPADLTAADALLVRSVTRVDATLLAGSGVRFVGSATAGVDHIDLAYLRQAGIEFAHAPGSNALAVAEYVACAVLDCCLRRGRASLAGVSAGVIGHGHTGTEVVRLLRALGITCLLNDPPRAAAGDPGPYVDLDTALGADIVTLHVPLTAAGPWPTRELLHAARIAALRPGTLLINAARGGVLDEAALCRRLVAAADLDVVLDCWAGEPLIDQALLRRVARGTPHVAGHTVEARWRGTWMLRQAYGRFAATSGTAFSMPRSRTPIELPGGTAMIPALAAVCRQAYDIATDSDRLKAGGERDPAVHFDQCRHDRQRHEFAHFAVPAATGGIDGMLRALGFAQGVPGPVD
ncbi:MAG: 4-phosphoerythronate dehydrogenase [Gammaproteobacteria bacterium]|nr:4-phosphoerythronate dehydrogenase [Gammaproteobacteria bacterium]